MVDINRHKFHLVQILKDIYTDIELANYLGFKGGTALMFFYDLPRFSVDLDFNLIDAGMEGVVLRKIRKILLKYEKIYGITERKLKVEISKRIFENRYEIKDLLGINVKVMLQEDMFAHKLCALLDRNVIANRDIFDCWFFLQRKTPVNKEIVESRMNMSLSQYFQSCIDRLESMSDKGLLQGMGELMDEKMKKFVQRKMRSEVIELLTIFKAFPIH